MTLDNSKSNSYANGETVADQHIPPIGQVFVLGGLVGN